MAAKYSIYYKTYALLYLDQSQVCPACTMATVIEFIIEPLDIIQLYPQLGEYVPIWATPMTGQYGYKLPSCRHPCVLVLSLSYKLLVYARIYLKYTYLNTVYISSI